MGKYSDTSVYSLLTQMLANDRLLFHADADGAEHLIAFSDLVKSIQALFDRRLLTAILTADVTLDGTHEFVVMNSGTPQIITLPSVASYPGKQYWISTKGSDVTIQRSGGDQIDSGTDLTLTTWKKVMLVSDGVDTWHAFPNLTPP